jgi:hypothetical protein
MVTMSAAHAEKNFTKQSIRIQAVLPIFMRKLNQNSKKIRTGTPSMHCTTVTVTFASVIGHVGELNMRVQS